MTSALKSPKNILTVGISNKCWPKMLVEWQVFITHKNYKNFSTFQFIIQHIIISCRLCLSPLDHSVPVSFSWP